MRSDFEKSLAYGFLHDRRVLVMMPSPFRAEQFEGEEIGKMFSLARDYYQKYMEVPEIQIIKTGLGEDGKKTLNDVLKIKMDFDKTTLKWIEDEADKYVKKKAMEIAIMESVPLLKKNDFGEIEAKIKDALTTGIKTNLGLSYYRDIAQRIERLWNSRKKKIPTGFAKLDEITHGGFFVPSLIVILGRINLGKSLFLSNMALNLSQKGLSTAIITLELSEDFIGQRIDAHLTGYDINTIYEERQKTRDLIALVKRAQKENWGDIYIKEFPPATVGVAHIRKYLHELKLMGRRFDVIVVDYLTLMRSFTSREDTLYMRGKAVSEGLRALSYEMDCPIVTVSQLNREGTYVDFEDLDMKHAGESMAIVATADFSCIIGRNKEEMIWENEISWKCIKNRMGPVGEVWATYLNPFSLRMYDDDKSFTQSFELSGGSPRRYGEK